MRWLHCDAQETYSPTHWILKREQNDQGVFWGLVYIDLLLRIYISFTFVLPHSNNHEAGSVNGAWLRTVGGNRHWTLSVNVSDSGCDGSVDRSRCALPFANACWEKAVAAMTLNGNEPAEKMFWLGWSLWCCWSKCVVIIVVVVAQAHLKVQCVGFKAPKVMFSSNNHVFNRL